MQILCEFIPADLYPSLHELLRTAYPGVIIVREETPGLEARLRVKINQEGSWLDFEGELNEGGRCTCLQERHILDCDPGERRNEGLRWARVFFYGLLSKHLGQDINPYGILTGMRPLKLLHRMWDQGWEGEELQARLRERYLLSSEKARLLEEIAANNRSFLLTSEKARKLISVYIGIPFCPSRCYYCSFTTGEVKHYESEVPPFLDALGAEMKLLGEYLREQGFQVQCIYIGGGTPTVLNHHDLQQLLEGMRRHLVGPFTEEITVEAGRPDTLDRQKLVLMKKLGVQRVCINPQTMHDSTLRLIGRSHDAAGVARMVEEARRAEIKYINMDLILGLPGEGAQENAYSAREVLKMEPDNITIHTLALKRGSRLAQEEDQGDWGLEVTEVERGLRQISELLREQSWQPYYLYRQKYMKASVENIGFSKPGCFCLYNIQIMEERQTVIGLGGGAASKFVNPADWSLSSVYNPKHSPSYIKAWDKLAQRKMEQMEAVERQFVDKRFAAL